MLAATLQFQTLVKVGKEKESRSPKIIASDYDGNNENQFLVELKKLREELASQTKEFENEKKTTKKTTEKKLHRWRKQLHRNLKSWRKKWHRERKNYIAI